MKDQSRQIFAINQPGSSELLLNIYKNLKHFSVKKNKIIYCLIAAQKVVTTKILLTLKKTPRIFLK